MLLDKFTEYVFAQDTNGYYRDHIACLSKDFVGLQKFASKTERTEFDADTLQALKIAIIAIQEAEEIQKNAAFEKESKNFLNKLLLKTLQIAQKSLALLLFKTPLRVAIAYNALHWVIAYLSKELKKSEEKDKKK
jgi:hypothetical protein